MDLPGLGRPEHEAAAHRRSLPEVHASVPVPSAGTWLRRLLSFAGPGYLVAVGYMDPGNWATDLAGGAQFGYTLLCVILLSNVMAILLQALAARLGIATGRDLAQACREQYSQPVGLALYVLCELAIIACDMAEVIGTAIALQLLFGLPLLAGVLLTVLDAMLVLLLLNKGFRYLEAFVIALLIVISACFGIQIVAAAPSGAALLNGLVPSAEVISDPAKLYIAMGIVGATVMPHNLYLHSSIVLTRNFPRTHSGRRDAIRWATVDSTVALMAALFINGAILVLAAEVFHESGHGDVTRIEDAYQLLTPLLGLGIASTLFAVALLASGLNSTVTATLAGQIVMEGFINVRLRPWARRLITRGLAVLPVVGMILIAGEGSTMDLLVLSQVILSMQLPFAVIPLVSFVSSRRVMGALVISPGLAALAWLVSGLLVVLDLKLLADLFL